MSTRGIIVSTQTRPGSGQFRLGDYLRLVRRRWWAVGLGLLVGLSGSYVYVSSRAQEYTSTASVQVVPISATDNGSVANGRTSGQVNLDTEAQLIKSSVVQSRAADLLHTTIPPQILGESVTVTVPANTSVLNISFTTDNPKGAAQGAHAFAEAYLGAREDAARTEIASQIKALKAQINTLTGQLRQVTGSIAALPSDSPDRAFAEARKDVLTGQIDTLNTRLVPLETLPVEPGRIITDGQ